MLKHRIFLDLESLRILTQPMNKDWGHLSGVASIELQDNHLGILALKIEDIGQITPTSTWFVYVYLHFRLGTQGMPLSDPAL